MPYAGVYSNMKHKLRHGLIYSRYHLTFDSSEHAKRYLHDMYDKVFTEKLKNGKFVAYTHLPTSDRLFGGKVYHMVIGAPTKAEAKRLADDIYKGVGYKIISVKPGYGVWIPKR